jgi:hypothetical protein
VRALQIRINASDRAYYADIIRKYPWPVSEILASSPASERSIKAAVRLSRRCERVAFDWLLEDIGWQPTPDEQGALLRHQAERVPLVCVIQHTHGGLTGWYLRPKIPAELLSWLCPVELGLRAPSAWQPEPGDKVIWMIKRLKGKACRYA